MAWVLVVMASVSGCKKEETPPQAGAIRALVSYATFRPACLTLSITDVADPTRTESTDVRVDPNARSDIRTVAIIGREGWSRNLRLVASAHERSCNGPLVALQEVTAQVPEVGTTDVMLALRADDLDDDGYVSAEGQYPGSDCDDTNPDIHPGATELCDGVDNNCVNGEADAPGGATYYRDVDGDGFGDPFALPSLSCIPPEGYVLESGDCNDRDPNVFPQPLELRCDNRDDNCDGQVDNAPFDVGTACMTAQNCGGTRQCTPDQLAAVCSSAEQPVEWFIDEDGDGRAGTSVGLWCANPPGENAVTERTDCDESSRYVFNGATEVCDRMDNDCDGQVDEHIASCDPAAWTSNSDSPNDTQWRAVAPYSGNRGWLAGDASRLAHVDGNTVTLVTGCPGIWRSAWTTNDGRVFLGSSAGTFTTRRATDTAPCVDVAGPGAAQINGIVGFENGNTVTLYAVDSEGRIIRWTHVEGAPTQAAPVLLQQVVSNLRAIDGTTPGTLFAAGTEVVGGSSRPVVWRGPADGGSTWTHENLGTLPSGGFLRSIRALSATRVVAAGDTGLLMELNGTTWTVKPRLTLESMATADIRAMVAFGSKAIYAVSSGSNAIHFFNGETWSSSAPPSHTTHTLGATGPTDIWAAGSTGVLLRWQP
ncbi:putative metal-binding motif-containing protein [Myxococcus hansupus]|uniref:putative metal-binding motif-containing protein n=1 Tax=Pseudomyxococcus hansupus TaxID=1297742 RepID=UPI001D0464D2|nr:putative metal-binding motif-containing protein [Myxococcus hansupus]